LITSNYGLVIESVCGNKQSTTKAVNVYSSLNGGQVAFNGTSKIISVCSGDDPSIILGSTTALAVAPSGGNGPWTYQWQYRDNCTGPWLNIPSSNSISYNPPPGLTTPRCYRRISSNSCGAAISDSVQVNIYKKPILDMDFKEVCSNKIINLTPTDTIYGSSGTFINYQISGTDLSPISNNGSYSPIFNSSNSGNYTFTYTITDGNSCIAIDTFSVFVNPNPILSIAPSTAESCYGDSISLNASVNSGNSPYSYSWTGLDTIYLNNTHIANPIFNSTSPGTFNLNLVVNDNKGCSANQTKIITVFNNPTVSVSNPSPDVCPGSSINLNTIVSNNNGSVNYSWSGQISGLSDSTISNPIYSNNTSGIYELQVWVSDTKLCKDSASIRITINNSPLISSITSTPLTYCGTNDGTILINATGSGNITYSIDSGITFVTTPLFNGLTNDTYYVLIKDDSSCISNVQAVTINNGGASSNPTILSSGQTICEGNSNPTLIASGTGIGQLSWYTNYPGQVIATGSSYTPALQDTGVNTYYVIENINTCLSDTSIISFNVLAAPKNPIFADNDTSVCEGSSITILAPNSPNNIIYYVYDNTALTPPALGTLNYTIQTINSSTTLYIQAEQNYGSQICKSTDTLTSYTINVNTAPPHPNLTASDDTICEGNNTTISALPLGNTYLLINSNNLIIDTLSAIVNPTVSTTYYVETYSNFGCKALGNRDSISIIVNPAPNDPEFNLNNQTICLGDSVKLEVQNPVNGENYSLYELPGNIFIGNAPQIVSPSVNTNYIIEAINLNGCKNLGTNDTIKILINPIPAQPLINLIPNDTVCAGTPVTIGAIGTQPGEYVLLFDQISGGNMLDTLNYSFTANSTVTYYAVTENNFGCRNSGNKLPILIVVDPLPSNPVLTSIPAFICEETSATITASSNPASSNITWWDGNNINSNVLDTGNTFTTPILNSTTTFYMLSVSDEGCTNIGGFIPVNVNVRPRPIVSLTSDAVLGFAYQGQLITFTAEPFGYQNYVFYINNNQVQNSSSNTYQNNTLNNGDWVSVSVTENGCESKDKAELKMEIKPLSNAFTPNNDGTNDLFLKGLELQILNRWGQELYKGIEGWDGAFQGKIVSPGTYFYIVTFKDLNGNETKLNGPVTLIGD
jgi:gliding motility-associated-like protein